MKSETDQADASQANRWLLALGSLSAVLYAAVAWLSWRFDFQTAGVDRPILAVLLLLAACFVCYGLAIALVTRKALPTHSLKQIVVAAVLFRIVMLFSLPIQEVDLYRYLWDGAVCAEGVSPFAYSPAVVQLAAQTSTDEEPLRRLVNLLDREPAMGEVLDRVHFAELPTIYPPTSQAVFAAVNLTTPSGSPLSVRVWILKAWLIGFDVGTLFVVIGLLRFCKLPTQLCLIYAWCPLLIKEVANSGHLDAIAVFLTTAAVYGLVRSGPRLGLTEERTISPGWKPRLRGGAAWLLGLAVGAKLYPIVLVPIFAAFVYRTAGLRALIVPMMVFSLTVGLLLYPMLPAGGSGSDPSRGVVTFLQQWEINDFLFMNIVENIKPTAGRPPHEVAWFSLVPETLRLAVVNSTSTRFNIPVERVPFLVTRWLTGLAFLSIALTMAWKYTGPTPNARTGSARLCEGVFLTVAWFWLLCPTQNPWYWTWALPLLPFAKSRVWLAVSGLTLVYYMRFWFGYHFPETPVGGTPYPGTAFFDFVVTWVEFAPWFACLLWSYLIRRRQGLRKP